MNKPERFVADAQSHVWDWACTSSFASDAPTHRQRAAIAIAQASSIIALHCHEWSPDLSPVWQAISLAPRSAKWQWNSGLEAFAKIVTSGHSVLPEWVQVDVDTDSQSLVVSTGESQGSMHAAVYTWQGPKSAVTPGFETEVSATVRMVAPTARPDVWVDASRVVMGDLPETRSKKWRMTTSRLNKAVELLRESGALPDVDVDRLRTYWEHHQQHPEEKGIEELMEQRRHR